MRLDEARSLLQRVSYKPGSKISIIDNVLISLKERAGLTVRIEQPVKNVNPPYDWTSVAKTFTIKELDFAEMDQKGFLDRLYREILDQEEHELREFFKVDGRHFIDPHPENKMVKEMQKWQHDALKFTSEGRPTFPTRGVPAYHDFFDRPLKKERYRWKLLTAPVLSDPRSVVKYIGSDLASQEDADEES